MAIALGAVVAKGAGRMEMSIRLFDFDRPSSSQSWWIVNDGVMGGISQSDFVAGDDGTVLFQGRVSLAYGGGFASVRADIGDRDLGGADGIRIRVLGDGKRYRLTVQTHAGGDRLMYQYGFETERDTWIEVHAPLAEFVPTFRGRRLSGVPPIDPRDVRSLGFLIADKQAGPFRLEIDSIGAFGVSGREPQTRTAPAGAGLVNGGLGAATMVSGGGGSGA
jgi:monofunctional biosynthetic peptidoglycan transglycosylase